MDLRPEGARACASQAISVTRFPSQNIRAPFSDTSALARPEPTSRISEYPEDDSARSSKALRCLVFCHSHKDVVALPLAFAILADASAPTCAPLTNPRWQTGDGSQSQNAAPSIGEDRIRAASLPTSKTRTFGLADASLGLPVDEVSATHADIRRPGSP